MFATQDGIGSSRKGLKGRLSLKDRQPSNRSPFPNIEQETDSLSLTELQRFEAALWQARNLWSIEQHRNGLADGRRLSRDAADRALRAGLAALEGNSLAKYRRGGGA